MTWIALIGVLASQGTSPIVKIERMIAPASETVKKIGAEYGEAWAVEGTVASDVVFVTSNGKSAGQMRQAIASALHAEWKEQSTGWVLSRKPATENRLAAEARALRTEWVKAELAHELDKIKKLPEFSEDRAKEIAKGLEAPLEGDDFSKRQIFISEMPGSRYLPQILALIDPATLAAMEVDERVVFATRPTAMQKQLPSAAQVLANDLAKKQAIMDGAMGAQLIRIGSGGAMSISRTRGGPDQPQPEPKGPPAYTHLIVSREMSGEMYSVQLNVYDAIGEIITGSSSYLNLSFERRPNRTTDTSGTAAIEFGKNEKEILALRDARVAQEGSVQNVFGISLASGGAGGTFISTEDRIGVGRPDISADLRAALLNPTNVDPLSYFFNDAAVAVSKERNLDVIAVVPDTLNSHMRSFARTDAKTSGFLAQLQNRGGMRVSRGEGWLTITPEDWPAMWQGRHNRSSLETLLGHLDQTGSLTLDQLSTYARTAPESSLAGLGSYGNIEGFYAQLLQPSAAQTSLANLFEHRRGLKFYAQLPVRTRAALVAGEEMGVAGLDSAVRGILHRMVYWGGAGPQPGTEGLESDPWSSGRFIRMGNMTADNERTVLMPRGITNDSRVRFQFKTEMSAEVKGAGGATAIYPANVLAMDQLQREGALSHVFGQLNSGLPPVAIEGFRDAGQSKIAMQFAFGTTATFSDTLTDYQMGSGAFGPYAGLSQILRDEVEKQANQIRSAFANVRLGGGENAKP